MKSDWTYIDFITLLYIQVVAADYCISEQEHEMIVEKVGKNQYKKILKLYIGLSEKEVFNLLKELAKKFNFTNGTKEKVFEHVREIIHEKGTKNTLEENMFYSLKKFL